jgi:hypothetical protein
MAANCSTRTVGGEDIAAWSERDDFPANIGNVVIFRQFLSHFKADIGFSWERDYIDRAERFSSG